MTPADDHQRRHQRSPSQAAGEIWDDPGHDYGYEHSSDPLRNDPRARACDVVAQQCALHPDIPPMSPDESGLDPRDAALAHSIYDAVIRRRVTLKPIISAPLLQKFDDLEPALQAALLVGAAQLLLLDRLPPHAVLDRTVEWAKVRLRPGAGNLVNAVLRKVAIMRSDADDAFRPSWTNRPDELPLSDGRALIIPEGLLPPDEQGRAAIANGIPKRLFARWCDQYGYDDAQHLASHSIIRPPTIINIQAWKAQHPERDLPEQIEPHESSHAGVWTGSRSQLRELIDREPLLWVQDSAAAEPLRMLCDDPPETLHDVCAGRGTKTMQALALLPTTHVIASDTNPDRLQDLRNRFTTHDRVAIATPPETWDQAIGPSDVALLDVPCSNTGVLARRVEARHRATKPVLARLIETQRSITTAAAERMSSGARLLYATCSIDLSENDAHAEWACATLGFEQLSQHRRLPSGYPGGPASTYSDGSFAVLLRKR